MNSFGVLGNSDEPVVADGETRPASRPPRAPGRRRSVLLVDDERHVVDALELHLEREFAVTKTTSPLEAIALLRDHTFDAVVSDLRMPEMSGVALLETVKRRSPSTARLLLSGQGDVDAAIAAINGAAVHHYLVKPCPASVVAEAIFKALGTHNGLDGDSLLDLGRRATLGTLAGSIGHEIGNLLVALESSISAVRDHVETGRPVDREDLSILDLVNIRLRGHTKQLSSLSKPRDLTLEDVDVAAVVVHTVGILQRVGVLKMADVTTTLPNGAAMARCDSAAVEAVLVNLLKNAAEALEIRAQADLEEGSFPAPCLVEVTVHSETDHIVVEVKDNGCGISPDRLKRLFEPFRTSKGARGTGLGLGIARAVLERQNGSLTAHSILGLGARFVMSLPRSPQQT